MKGFLIAVTSMIFGVLIGAFIVGRLSERTYATQHFAGVMELANVGLYIRANREDELLKGVEQSLPVQVLAIHNNLSNFPGSTNALWMAKAYYERNSLRIPQEIAPILNSLPARPPTACQIRLKNLEKAIASGTTNHAEQK
jgi:hypothetical protein